MTKAEIEKLIAVIDNYVPKHHVVASGEKEELWCRMDDLHKVLRDYPVESDDTCGPNYKAMCEVNAMELDKAKAHIDSLKFDLHNLSVEHAHYVGAVAAMETIFGRKFEPQR